MRFRASGLVGSAHLSTFRGALVAKNVLC